MATPGGSGNHGNPSVDPYLNPLRAAHATAERIDMGADFSGSGTIYALGPGVIIESDNAWAGSTPGPGSYIAERLTAGPATGQIVYVAEDINSLVHVGQKVNQNTPIARWASPGGQMETGWSSGTPGTTMAQKTGQGDPVGDIGGWSTAFGDSYAVLLASLGAPADFLQGGVIHGKVPKSWFPQTSTDIKSTPVQATDTSFLTNILGANNWQDMLERLGLIVLGGVLVVVGIWMLASKQEIQLIKDVVS